MIKRYKLEIISFSFLVVIFLFSRLINLTSLPIFTDEAIYLRWAQIAKNDASWRFISLIDGKQPLFVWVTMVAMKFISDPLLSGRIVSVLTGLLSLIGMWFLGYEIGKSKRTAFLASFLYLILPFSLMYDRMALMDGMVATFAIWSLYFEILLVRTLRLDVALILGMILGGGVLTKTSGFFSIYLLPFSLILFDWQKKDKWRNLAKWIGLSTIAVILSQFFYSILRLSPLFHMIAQKDTTFIWTFSQFAKQPFPNFWGNLRGLWGWFTSYMTYPFVFLILISLVIGLWKKEKEKLLILFWFIIPFLALASFGKVIYPRFILFMSIPLLALAADSLNYGLVYLKNKFLLIILTSLLLVYPIYFSSQIVFNIKRAPLTGADRGQYIFGQPAGGGVREAIAFFAEQAKDKKIFIATEGTFGLMPYALELYLVDEPNIEIKGYWPVEKIPEEVLLKAKVYPTFFLFYQRQDPSSFSHLKLIKEYRKGLAEDQLFYLRVFEVIP